MTNPSLRLLSPAKLNLFLHITGRRADGYHQLQTVFQLLDVGDYLDITANNSGEITLTPSIPGVKLEDNLIYRAATALKRYAKPDSGARIQIDKRLPMGGGIGGGSSNAATTMLALNHLWKTGLPVDDLAALGLSLGADIPVFVHGQSCWAEGVGEQLTPIELGARFYVVLAPRCHVSTAHIFSHKDLTRDTPAITVAAFFERGGKNDCQTLVETLFPQVRDAVEWLSQYGPAQLTGTGACVFAPFSSDAEAKTVFAKRPESIDGFVAKGVDLSPTHQCLP